MRSVAAAAAAAAAASKPSNPLVAFEHKRDAYGFPVRPQHVQRYREYADIYKVLYP
jgi:sugar (pentulose or hexulose) kinase